MSTLLLALANTGHVEVDELATPETLRDWWSRFEFRVGAEPVLPGSEADLAVLRTMRQLIRRVGLQHNDVAVDVDTSALQEIPLQFEMGECPKVVVVEPDTLARHITGLALSEILTCAGSLTWRRLKACPGPDCEWVFVDRSRNGSRRWCQMSACGNRAKASAFRARQRSTR